MIETIFDTLLEFNDFYLSYKKKEGENDITYYLNIPELTKKDIEIENRNNNLIIKLHYTKDNIFCQSKQTYYIKFDGNIDSDKITSKLENGVLMIKLPYKKENYKKIEIQ